jgi:osmotically-inducible protein OsmY
MLERLWMDPGRLEVTVDQGNVVLGGDLDSEDMAESIVEFARRTPGVVSVESTLTWPGKTKPRRGQPTPA